VNTAQISARLNQPFSEQKTRDELVIVPRCTHRDGEWLASDANLEGLFDGEFVRVGYEFFAVCRRAKRANARHWHTVAGSPKTGGRALLGRDVAPGYRLDLVAG